MDADSIEILIFDEIKKAEEVKDIKIKADLNFKNFQISSKKYIAEQSKQTRKKQINSIMLVARKINAKLLETTLVNN